MNFCLDIYKHSKIQALDCAYLIPVMYTASGQQFSCKCDIDKPI